MADYYVDYNGNISSKKKKEKEKENQRNYDYSVDSKGNITKRSQPEKVDSDIAPVKETKKEKKIDFFDKGAFENGYQFGDVTNSVLATPLDLGLSIVKGAGRMVEGVADLAGYGIAGVSKLVGADKLAEDVKKEAKKDYVGSLTKGADKFLDQYSVLGRTGKGAGEGLGQVGTIILTGGVAAGAGLSSAAVSALTTGATFASSAGSGIGEAYEGNATDGEAWAYGLSTGAIEAGTELLFGGLGKSVKAIGLSKGITSLDDVFAKKLSSKISNQFYSNLVEYGVKSSAEGAEEVLAGIGSATMKKLTYMSDAELSQLIEDENLLEQFVLGTVTSGLAQSGYVPAMKNGSLREANAQGKDFITGLTQNEQAVIDKSYEKAVAEAEKGGTKLTKREKTAIYDNIVEKMDKGDIDIDTIEEVLGGKTFEEYKSITEQEKTLTDEISQLENTPESQFTVKQRERLTEARKQLENLTSKTELKEKLSAEVYGIAKNSRLVESYNEKARKSQAFEADLTKYTGKQRTAVERAIKSGVLNNTNKSHALVDTLSKIEAEKGIVFDFTDNAKLKESGFAIEGKTVNGFVKNGAVTLNVQSAKSWQSVVGHEISHVLEGTDSYTELQKALFEYAESKGELESRRTALTELYNGVDADIDAELTADLVGDYLFSDSNFIKGLTTNKNLFQKIYDEIKYLCKVATGKQLTDVEKVKREFDKVWEEFKGNDSQNNITNDDVKYSISGKKALTANKNKLYDAMRRTTLGEDAETVRKDTGWYKGKDNKWRFYIPDNEMKVVGSIETNNSVMLGDYIEHHKLFTAYPDLKDVNVRFGNLKDTKNGQYSPENNEIVLNNKLKGDIEKQKNTLIHEIQHAIQNIEDFAVGGNRRTGFVYALNMAYDKAKNSAEFGQLKNKKEKHDYIVAVAKNLFNASSERDLQYKAYRSLYGEVEARQVTQNRFFDEDLLRLATPDTSGNVINLEHETKKFIDNFTEIGYNEGEIVSLLEGVRDDKSGSIGDIESGSGGNEDFGMLQRGQLHFIVPTNGIDGADGGNQGASRDNKRGIRTIVPELSNTLSNTRGLGGRVTADNTNEIAPIQEASSEGGVFFDVKKSLETTNSDVRFSLSDTVEETKDLVAVHNLQSSELMKTLELGGLPMPSIAVIKAQQSHEDYGDVSLIFPKETIDPKKNKANKVYGGDAWTPTYPRIEYKVNEKSQKAIRNKINSLVPYDVQRGLGFLALDYDNMTNDLNRHNGDIGRVYENNYAMQYAFLVDNGFDEQLPTAEKHLDGSGRFGNPLIVDVVKRLGDAEIERLANEFDYKDDVAITKLRDIANESFKSKYAGNGELLKALRSKPFYNDTNFGFAQADSIIRAAYKYVQNGFEQEVDYKKATDVIKNAVDETAYKKWLNDLFADVVEKEGIYNGKDIFTPSGNRRSWDALHWENTLENVVKVMKSQDQTGADAFAPTSALFAVANKKYGSIDQIKADSHRLGKVSEEDYEAYKKSYGNRLVEIADSITDQNENNRFYAMDNAAELIVDAVRNCKTKSAMLQYMRQYNNRVTESTVDDIFSLVSDIANMPTGYFEAKPQRAVGLEEVGVFVIPNNTDVKLKQELLNKGYSIAEYDPTIEGDRQKVVNQFEEYKFSLSNVGEQVAPVGNYSTPLNETALVPIKEDIVENATPTEIDDIAPMPTDADAPPETEMVYYGESDVATIDDKTLNNIGKSLRDTLSLTPQETKAIQEIVQEYSTTENPNKDELFNTIKEKFGEKVWKEKNQDLAEVKRFLRTAKINVSQGIKSDIADYGAFRKSIGNKLATSKDGLPVDVAYQQLVEMYPEYFSEDIWHETDRFLRMADVASMDLYSYESYPLDDVVIQEAVNIILNEVRGYKENLTKIAAEETATEALNSIAPPKAVQLTNGSRGDALLHQSLDNHPVKTVDDKIAEKLRAVEAELADNKQLRRETEVDYNREIERLSQEYIAKADKNTKVANNIIRRIARLERLKASADADYGKRISDLEARVEKMQDPKYNRAMHKQAKMQENAEWAENLLGDTSTWKDKKIGLQYATNTERRNLRDIVRDENGNQDIARADAINDALNGRYNREEAAKKRELSQTRGKYADLKITKAEDAYIQMLGELRGNPETELTEKAVKEYYEKHKNKIDTAKVEKVIELARKDYDDLLKRVNEKLKEQGMKEIPYRKGYFPHFTEPKQNFIQKLLNWKTQDNEIPTSIAGLTEDFKPVKSWQSFDKTRHSDTTDYSFLKGFDTYSEGALDWIYHLDTLQKRRAVENHIRNTHSDEGIRTRIKEVYADEGIDATEAQSRIEGILAEAKNPLNNFVQDFTTHTNILAGKKNSLDRTTEQWTNRKIYSVMTNVQNRMSANMVLANVRSALTNFIPITQSWAQVSPLRSLQATKDTIANAIKDDGIIEKSTFLTNRLKNPDSLYKTNWDKIIDGAGIMFEVVDNISSQVIWRSKYNQNLANGMSESAAIENADQFAENVMAGRSKGNEPTIFNAKNPLTKAFTMFQLEVNNQYGYLFKDVPNDLKAETNHWKFNLAKGYTTAFIGAYVYNALLEQVAGSGAALDPIGIIEDLLKDLGLFGDDEEEKDKKTALLNFGENVIKEIPLIGNVAGGGRIPISSAIPYSGEGFMGGLETFAEDVSEGNWGNIGKEMMNPLLNVVLPVGGGQLKKTAQGLGMFNTDEEHPIAGSYTDSGALRFPVEDTLANRIQAGIFGQYASKNAREYFDNGYAPLKEKQIQEYIDLDLPIADYWKYREGLSDLTPLEGKKTVTLNQKGDYISGLDLPVSKKNILINNIANDRKTPIDYTGYENYSNFEEFDFATRYPEKYAVLQEQGISVADYKKNYEEAAFMYTDDYSWAANNPEQYTVSKVVTSDVREYKRYITDLYNIKSDKDASGKSVSGSRKEKVIDYVNNLNLDYGAKIILFKKEYPSDDTYNADIIDYLNNRNDLTYEERITIFTELGFTVKEGYVYWD